MNDTTWAYLMLGLSILVFITDILWQFWVAGSYGPQKAKSLTVQAFQEPQTAEAVRRALGLASSADLVLWRADLVRELDAKLTTGRMDTERQLRDIMANAENRIASQLRDGIPPPRLTPATEEAIQRSIRGSLKAEIGAGMAALEAKIMARLDEKVGDQTVPMGLAADVYDLSGLLIDRGVPAPLVDAAIQLGSRALPALRELAAHYGVMLPG